MHARNTHGEEHRERRAGARLTLAGGLPGAVLLPQPITVTELAVEGAQVETAFPLQLESLHELRLDLGSVSLVVKGRVTHCGVVDLEYERVCYRSGIEFVDTPQHARTVVSEFLDRVKSARSRLSAL